jgi:hypothetical protein
LNGFKLPRQIVCEILSQKYPTQKRAGGVAQGVGPEFKFQHCKKKKKFGQNQLKIGFQTNIVHECS